MMSKLPLSDMRVLDLTRLLPGAVSTMMLEQLGADVLKVESPDGGDYARWMPPLVDGLGVFFRATNRGKRSIILNLKDERGQEALRRLAAGVDVLIEGFRPGVMARLDCGYEALKAINPRLVYCALSGWGQDGPYAQKSGHDLNYLAVGGLLGAMGKSQPLGGQVADVGGSYAAASAILAALLVRERHGEGCFLDVALFEAGLPFVMQPWVEALTTGVEGGEGTLTGGYACYNVYTAADGEAVTLAALEPKFWANFCVAVGRLDWQEDYLRPERQERLKAEVARLFASRTAAKWEELLGEADCCFARVKKPSEVQNDLHVQAREMMGVDERGVPWMRSPLGIGEAGQGDAPGYGEHTREALREVGYGEMEIEELVRTGVVGEEKM